MEPSDVSPFGNPDGVVGPFEHDADFVLLDRKYGAAARPAVESSRTRVIAGAQGAGKTLLLRRLNEHYRNQPSVYSVATFKGRELDTDSVVKFSQLFPRTTNAEKWTLLWDRAIHASATTHLLHDAEHFGDVDPDLRDELEELLGSGFRKVKSPHDPISVAGQLVRSISSPEDFEKRIFNESWTDLADAVRRALRHSRELYLFVDAIDDNYRYAPTYWQQCQRGLFHAVMDTQRTEVEASKLHVVISIRDLTLSSVAQSEHAPRYFNNDSIIALTWSWSACKEFFAQKLTHLDPSHFRQSNEKTLAAFLGTATILNETRGMEESVEQYLLRHTRQSPRDIISLGNALVVMAKQKGKPLWELDQADIRNEVAAASKTFARAALAQAGNQVLANVMPWNASRHSFSDYYLGTDEYTADAMVREVSSVLLTLPGERITHDQRLALEAEAESRFGARCHFIDVLWQNRIMGVSDHGAARFYGGALTDEVAVPTADFYVLHSLFLDALPAVPLNSSVPVFPGGALDD
ncbi:P-loop ATPase, Sll1717 family [Microbacterium pumilum]|uniref:Orc1-like AAA ATPase domain-containing protein n=1 Tax=Microbacterium pumilum TaxID=344165 RepID=A0ABN2RSW9_9MICO